PPGEVSTTTRADAGARISDSPITIIGTTPQQVAPRSAATAPQVAELELGLHRADSGYVVDARLSRGQSDVELSGSSQRPAPAVLDLSALRAEELNLSAYGQLLTEGLLADRALRDFVMQALSVTQSAGQPLSLQLRIASSAPELHALRWETLCHPTSGDPLALSQHIWMARTLGSADWAPITRPDRQALRALGIIAAPTNLTDFNLSPIDTVRETELARATFGSRATVIAGHAASLRRIGPALRTGYDILYLVAHGRMIGAEAHLYLAGDDGRAEVVRAAELITRVRELKHRPRLAILTVCNSAGRGDEHAIAALGPQLIAAGVPAVVAAQGNLSIESAATFNPVLFQNLQQHGQIDQAVAEARASIRDRHDWWAPALLTRLRGRQLWE
ncbi:CHAT domain-containing protein, partial [Oscillochloris sp. ZM17-4]|uniref:CHAT domain-containing protein n=1 Tax=Oscillochloris sp. ZM17-4 TaxID=2866714 RepID=UPI001C72CFB4